MTIERLPTVRPRIFILAAGAVVLTWLVISQSLAAYLAGVAPKKALRLDARQPDALVNVADQMLNGFAGANGLVADTETQSPAPHQDGAAAATGAAASSQSSGSISVFDIVDQQHSINLATARARAEAGLASDPLNARALRVLGQIADAAKDDAGALKFMRAAARLSLHDPIADYWLMVKSAEAKDYQATIYYADVLLRTTPDLSHYVVPMLAHLAEDKDTAGLLKTELLDDPPWRSAFLQELPASVTDARTPLDLLMALRQTPDPPTSDEVNRYLNFLIAHNLYDLAYYTWLQFLPSQDLRNAGLLYNGSFAIAPSGSPFDWVITPGSGVTVDVEARSDANGEAALVLNFEYGRVDYHSVTQLIMLTPGHYQFSGQYQGNLIGPRGLRWRIACAETPTTPIAEGAMIGGRATAWRDTTLDVTVPEQNCRAQYLSLDLDARMPSEQFVTGSIRFSELRIARLATADSQ
jgi:hypothetical protein